MLQFLLIGLIIHVSSGNVIGKFTTPAYKNASQTESPWAIHITIKNKQCGGALINDTHILTAAHCFDSLKYSEFLDLKKMRKAVQIRIGEWKTNTDPDCGEDQSEESCDTTADIFPKEIIIHEGYNKREEDSLKRYKNDVAIIKLGWPPRRSELIYPIKLAGGESCQQESAGEVWKSTGFGNVLIKKKSELNIMSQEDCKSSIHSDFIDYFNDDHICGSGKVACIGDGGNPVTNIIEGVPYLQGIVGYTDNEDCDEPIHTATVLVKVSCFFDWIVSKVPSLQNEITTEKATQHKVHEVQTDIENEIVQDTTKSELYIINSNYDSFATSKWEKFTKTTPNPKVTIPMISYNKNKIEDKKYHSEKGYNKQYKKVQVTSTPSANDDNDDELGIHARIGETGY